MAQGMTMGREARFALAKFRPPASPASPVTRRVLHGLLANFGVRIDDSDLAPLHQRSEVGCGAVDGGPVAARYRPGHGSR
jgi:hypothetical protein